MIPTPARLTYSVPAPKLKCPSIPVSDPTRTEVAADSLLIQRFNAGDETAFVELVQRSRSRICLSPQPVPRVHTFRPVRFTADGACHPAPVPRRHRCFHPS